MMTSGSRTAALIRMLAFAGATSTLAVSLTGGAALAQPASAPAPSPVAGNAETRFSEAWYQKFAPQPHGMSASGSCLTYLGHMICAATGSVPSHGKSLTATKKPVVKPKR